MTASVDCSIHTIDTGFGGAQFDAAYLVVEAQRGALIDCGTSLSVPHLLAAVQAAGLAPAQVEWLILTHVHLDHAGGAGALLQHLPNARVLVHPRGAPHMIDPMRLIAGATAVYGEEEVARSYGQIVPVPAERVVEAADGQPVLLGERVLRTLETPGHARHHLCVWDARSRSWFTGDTFGLSYRQLDSEQGAFILPTSSPVQFGSRSDAAIDRTPGGGCAAGDVSHPLWTSRIARCIGAGVGTADPCDDRDCAGLRSTRRPPSLHGGGVDRALS